MVEKKLFRVVILYLIDNIRTRLILIIMRLKLKNSYLFFSFFSFAFALTFWVFFLLIKLGLIVLPINYAQASNLTSLEQSFAWLSFFFDFPRFVFLSGFILLGFSLLFLFKFRKEDQLKTLLSQSDFNLNLKVLESLKIDQKNNLFLVRAFEEYLLISSVDGKQNSLLSRIPAPQKKLSGSDFLQEKRLQEIVGGQSLREQERQERQEIREIEEIKEAKEEERRELQRERAQREEIKETGEIKEVKKEVKKEEGREFQREKEQRSEREEEKIEKIENLKKELQIGIRRKKEESEESKDDYLLPSKISKLPRQRKEETTRDSTGENCWGNLLQENSDLDLFVTSRRISINTTETSN